jgi:hypothetical protein
MATGEQVFTLQDTTEASSVIAAVPGGDDLVAAQGRMIRRWSPAPWKQISASADMLAEFEKYRQTRSDQIDEPTTDEGFQSQLVVMPSVRVTESLSALKDDIANESDSISFAADNPAGFLIVEASDQRWLELGLADGDLIQSIGDTETTTADSAQSAIESAMEADEVTTFSMNLIRTGQPIQITVQRRPTTTEVVNISHSRSAAIDRYERFAESLRSMQQLQSGTSADEIAKAGGIVLAGKVSEQDREQMIQSGIALQDVVIRFMDEPVTGIKQLIADMEDLVEQLKSEQLSEFEVEVRRGEFHQVKINNVVN